ncbi:hypothetical protein LTR09_012786 [Extremus antarcticus]|uniref:Uncharacterized protein n=1 Tax=Extremus antarcticus TaxID=702011 RepID=A0AAJ0D4S8_9PEZI|nr:hypothetical protein LTR09_012786 [Extremus antarcticus]
MEPLSANFHRAAASYSTITLFEEQHHDVDAAVLHELAKMFVRHKLHEDFGISLLHRHDDIANDLVMVHTRSLEEDRQVDRCRPEILGLRPIFPILFFLYGQREYLPYEFSAHIPKQSTQTPNKEFLEEFASFLQNRRLEDTLGLFRREGPEEHWLEQTLPQDTGTIATITALDNVVGCVATRWIFVRTEQTILVKTVADCIPTSSAGHDRPPPK